MPYTKLLNQLIDASGLSAKEIAERCTELGQRITASYISILRKPENARIPSDDMSRVLAKVLGAEHQELLVIEAYIDKAPPEFSGVLYFLKKAVALSIMSNFVNAVGQDEMNLLIERYNEMPMASIVIAYQEMMGSETTEKLPGPANFLSETTEDEYSVDVHMSAASGFLVPDDSMFPTLPKDSRVTIETKQMEEYQDGDILCFILKGEKEIQYRKVGFLDDEHTQMAMFPLNDKYKTKTYSIDKISVLGKVNRVVVGLK